MSRARGTSGSSIHLEIPRKSTEIEDPGAHELSSDDEFQDASEDGKRASRPITPSSPTVPITRVEKVDDDPRHGEVPGTPAYDKRRQDAVPDEIEIVPEGGLSKRSSRQFLDTPLSPGGTPVPRTVVEKIDPSESSYGDEPGTPAYRKRLADAVPDLTLANPDPSHGSRYKDSGHNRSPSTASVPETIVTRADDELAHGEVPGTAAAGLRKEDAAPDHMEIERDVPDDASQPLDDNDEDDIDDIDDGDNDKNAGEMAADTFGDDFDDFEEGAQAGADDDFGDFDDFESQQDIPDTQPSSQPQLEPTEPTTSAPSIPTFPLFDFGASSSLPTLLENTKPHLDAMFPSTIELQDASTSTKDSSSSNAVFPTDRSHSLWKQLITPPPLQPPNWTQSRIRRLFLISLGVPVDLDEILPPSKQKKLILPDITTSARTSAVNDDSPRPNDALSKLRSSAANDSTTSITSDASASTPTGTPKARGRPRPTSMKPGPPPPPSLDLQHVKRLCATTPEKLAGFTDDELKAHVSELEGLTERTSQVLEYWLKKRDGARKEKEAFEGVIENLVRHAQRVRTIK